MFSKEEINEQDRLEWRRKAQKNSPVTCKHPDWLPISKKKTEATEHVTVIMCKSCFHLVNLTELYKHRETN